MKFTKINTLCIISALLFLTSCGKDETEKSSFTYRSTRPGKVVVWVGSDTNGAKLDTFKVANPLTYFGSMYENFTNTSISLTNDLITIVKTQSKTETNRYRWDGDQIVIYAGDSSGYFGYRIKDSLIITQHYLRSVQKDGTIKVLQVPPLKNITMQEVAKYSPFGSVDNMKTKGDTLMWFTRYSSFF